MYKLTIPLDAHSKVPLYEQIYEYIKKEILKGSIPYDEKLPSTRALSSYLQVSRSTVDLAYEQLLSEGYLESVPYIGYYVCQVDELYHIDDADAGKWTDELTETDDQETGEYRIDASPNAIDLENFPYNTWRKLSREVLQDEKGEVFQPGHPKGEHELRRTIRRYLHQARGVNCSTAQIIVGAGNDYLLLLLGMLLGEDRIVAMENPSYRQAYQIFCNLNYDVVPVSMDKGGMMVSQLERTPADVAYVMPSHQYPLGTVMPITRRLELLGWAAAAKDRYIIEDDHDSEFRYRGKPIPALQGYDRHDKVIYTGTFSKSIAPAIRISYMVLPEPLLARYEEKLRFMSNTVSRIDQMILNRFMKEGYYERHLNKMRAIYKSKHDALLAALKQTERTCEIQGANAGLHILLQMPGYIREEFVTSRLREAGIRLQGVSEAYITDKEEQNRRVPDHNGILIGYGNLTETQIQEIADEIYKII